MVDTWLTIQYADRLCPASSQAIPGSGADGMPHSPWYFLVTVVTESALACCVSTLSSLQRQALGNKQAAKFVESPQMAATKRSKNHTRLRCTLMFETVEYRATVQSYILQTTCLYSCRCSLSRSNLALFRSDGWNISFSAAVWNGSVINMRSTLLPVGL